MIKKAIKAIIFSLVAMLLPACQIVSQHDPIEAPVSSPVEEPSVFIQRLVQSESGVEGEVVAAFYARRNFDPVWNRRNSGELINLLLDAYQEGFHGDEFGVWELERFNNIDDLPSYQRAEADVFLSSSFFRYIRYRFIGKARPDAVDHSWDHPNEGRLDKLLEIAETVLQSGAIQETVQQYTPSNRLYKKLRSALNRYRKIEQRGGWLTIPLGPVIKLGVSDPRVPFIRLRLQATGDLDESKSSDSFRFDTDLAVAVRHFQFRHNIKVDGIAGLDTQMEMNRPVRERIDQIRLNLERARWLSSGNEQEMLVVNIAGFKAYLVRDDKVVWQTRAQVGTPYRKSPLFKSKMKYVVFNPTWTVPPTILEKDILPKLQAGNLDYLKSRNIRVVDFKGNPVEASSVKWTAYKARNLPYLLRQDAGAGNVLGRMKFVFPNSYTIFIHDTPSKGLFGKQKRAFSSGCIRIERPYELAQLVLGERNGWTTKRLKKLVSSGETKSIYLPRELSVWLTYWTVDVADNGQVIFIDDVYERDQTVLDKLNRMAETTAFERK
jgi:murein L,D-transpeptidase YcbB/YkuD